MAAIPLGRKAEAAGEKPNKHDAERQRAKVDEGAAPVRVKRF
jgi:hypothetical protein